VLHVLATLASLTECDALHTLLICLKHFTMATLSAAVFSIAARFFSLVGVNASVLDNAPGAGVQMLPIMTNVFILMATYLACRHEVGAGITVFQEVRREENFGCFLQMLADMARVYGLTAAIVACASLAFLIGIDVKVAMRAVVLHCGVMVEYRKVAASKGLEEPVEEKPSPHLPSRAMDYAPAATGGI
ncbi:hypothetical protein MTO96_038693, partial [Rhipicephalus appendiculatus]